MKRLLCIVSNMNAGGAETFLMKLFRNIDRTQYMMDFCVNRKDTCFYEEEIYKLGGKIFEIPSKSDNLKAFKKALFKLVKEEKYEYVLRITSNTVGFMDLKIAKKAGAKVCSARSSNSSDGGSLKSLLVHKLGRLLYGKYVDVKFAPSDLAAKYTFGKKAYENGVAKILHNAIDLDVFSYKADGRDRVREEFKINDNTIVVGHMGRFMTQKNHMFLLDIFDEYHKKHKNSVLMLVGKGELEQQIKGKIADKGLTDSVIFTGVRSDVPDVFSAMDVFVMPSLYEGMPNVVIEAQATGLPCIIADTITKEADITGLVSYMSLQTSAKEWAEKVGKSINTERVDTKENFIKNGYDIRGVADEFIKLVFGE